MAHLALQAWAESGEWALPDPGTRLQERFDEVAAAHQTDPVRMPQGVVTRARLKTRAKQIAEIFSGANADIHSEVLLRDGRNNLFGIVDIVGHGSDGFIVDLKTGRDTSAKFSPAVEHQMTFYAHLFQAAYGKFPKYVIVFSLQRGPEEIQVSPSAVAALLDRIRAAQLSERTEARPEADTCRFCPRRMTCEPHWDAAPDWERPDAIEGTIDKIERSTSGTAALLIGGRWLTGVAEDRLPDSIAPGKFVRAVRVQLRSDGEPEEWAAGGTTLVRISPET